jgi:hypothetical protein
VVFANVGSKTWLQQRWRSMCSWAQQTQGVTVSHASYNSYLMYQNVHHALNHPWLCYSRHAMPPMGAFSRGEKVYFSGPRVLEARMMLPSTQAAASWSPLSTGAL